MKKILYLHGFGSSGASGTVDLLRREFWDRTDATHRAVIVAPDIPLDPLVALPMLKKLASDENPDLVVGTSFEQHYPGMSHTFPGGHRMNAHVVTHTLLPYIRSLNVI